MHKRCGKDCIHVTRYLLKLNRFYMRLGFVPVKYLNKRKAMKLSKPVVLPGFPKVWWIWWIDVLLFYLYNISQEMFEFANVLLTIGPWGVTKRCPSVKKNYTI